jgi:hypothetical protein
LAEARRLGQRRWALLLLTNSAADAVWTGDWDWALAELADELTGELEREDRFIVLSRTVILEAYRGTPVDGLLDEMEHLVGVAPDLNHARFLTEVRAARAFSHGELRDSGAAYRQLARTDPGNARHYLVLAARAALLDRDDASAAADLDALQVTGVHGIWTDACRTSIRAGLAALDGRPADAISLYRTALRGLDDAAVPFDQALTTIEMATFLDPDDPDVRAAAGSAREILTRLGAKPLLARLDAAMERQPAAARHEPARSPDPPTV